MQRINLLGKPFVEREGERLPSPRGRKAWALLTYLACAGGAHSREHLAALLFGDADDPLGAVRWNLAEIRRIIDDPSALRGDVLRLELAPGTSLDVRVVATGSWIEAIELPGLGRELLEGLAFGSSPAFESWLVNERRHQQAMAEAAIREASLARLGSGDTDGAIDLAARLVAMAPFEEPYQELLIRSYAVAGDRRSAQRQLAACIELYRRELGVEPGSSVFAAADAAGGTTVGRAVAGPAAARAQLDAGRAAIDAGAVDAGIDCLRRAVSEAQTCGDTELKAEALVALGSAFVHMVRGRDEEGAAVLHEALSLTEPAGRHDLATVALLELCWIEVLAGRYERALSQLERARREAPGDPDTAAMLDVMAGATYVEMGRYDDARGPVEKARAVAERGGSRRTLVYCLGEVTRLHFMLGDFAIARDAAVRALSIAREQRMTSVLPLAEGILGITLLKLGSDLSDVAGTLEHAFAFGCQIGDPCAESAAAHGLGLLHAAQGDVAKAIQALDDARHRCLRRGDASIWFQAWALDSLCTVAVDAGEPSAARWIADLESLAGRTGMRDFLARAFAHRARCGDDDALETARLLAADVGSPALTGLIEASAARR